MQIFSFSGFDTLAVLSSAEMQKILAQSMEALRQDAGMLILLFLLSQLATIICYWISSKLVCEETGTFPKALGIYFLGLLVPIVIGFVLGFAIGVFSGAHGRPGPMLGAIVIAGLVAWPITMIALAMRIYRIGFLRTILFFVLAVVASFASHVALNHTVGRSVLGPDRPLAKAIVQLREFVLAGTVPNDAHAQEKAVLDTNERIAADSSKSIEDRQKALNDQYQLLTRMYQTLPPGQNEARTAYDVRKMRYEQLLAQLRKDAAERR